MQLLQLLRAGGAALVGRAQRCAEADVGGGAVKQREPAAGWCVAACPGARLRAATPRPVWARSGPRGPLPPLLGKATGEVTCPSALRWCIGGVESGSTVVDRALSAEAGVLVSPTSSMTAQGTPLCDGGPSSPVCCCLVDPVEFGQVREKS